MPMNPVYQELPAHKALHRYVECFWSSSIPHGTPSTTHRILPDGCIDFIFDVSPNRSPQARLVGTMTRPLLYRAGGDTDFVAVRFRPGGATPFVGVPAHEITDMETDLCSVWNGVLSLDRLSNTLRARDRIQLLESALLRQLSAVDAVDSRISSATAALQDPRASVDGLAHQLDLTRQHLSRLFRRHVGVTPKKFQRVIRMQKLTEQVRKLRLMPDWAQFAQHFGYSDQAHLVNECRTLTGVTPTEFFAEQSRS